MKCKVASGFSHLLFPLLQDRCLLFDKAKQNLTIDDDWTLAQTLFGVTTHYRRESDGSLSIKLEGSLQGVSLFDQVAILREVDLHCKWAPFCSSSLTVRHLGKLDTVGWFCVGLPHFGLIRDGCFRAIGCDSIYEDGSVLLVAQGIQDQPEDGAHNKHLDVATKMPDSTPTASTKSSSSAKLDEGEQQRLFDLLSKDPILKKLDVPAPPTRIGSGRMTIRTFQALINIESPTHATTKLVTNIDPNLPLVPQSLIDFLMKRLCGVLLSKMQGAARKIERDPITNHHAVKMREERDFYQRWLLPKFQDVCKLRGWKMPPISAFELSEAQIDVANALAKKEKPKQAKKLIKHAHTLSEVDLDRYLDGAEMLSLAESEPTNVGQRNNAARGPKIRTRTFDSDDFSDLSRSTSSIATFFGSNPISNYLREIEERTQARKDEEIAKSRERAANRLKPKELDEESRSRLDELRIARDRRLSTSIPESGESPYKAREIVSLKPIISSYDRKRDWAVFWTKHGFLTKMIVMSLLTGSLFGLLHSDVVFEKIVPSRDSENFWMHRKRDVATLAYLGTAGIVHFFQCYVALMYAFSALQLGSIAGQQAKKFYSQNVHLIVALSSTSMILLGIAYTGIYNTCQWMVWKSHLVFETVQMSASSIPTIPTAVLTPFHALVGLLMSILSGTEKLMLESNVVGRGFRTVLHSLWSTLEVMLSNWNAFIDLSIGEYEGTVSAIPWREQTFFATRVLLSYSAIFLMVLLFLFNLMAWQARRLEVVDVDDGPESEIFKAASVKKDVTIANNHTMSSRSMSPMFDPIQEED
jgi:hypothetical protein